MLNQNQIVLTEKQTAAVNAIRQFIDSDELFFCLKGFAGTGKTTVINHVIASCNDVKMIVTAPTNKAVNVIRQMQHKAGLHFDTMTIHQYLGVKQVLKYDKEGHVMTQEFEAVYGTRPDTTNKVVIVDEASMIDKRLMKMIVQQAEFSDTKFIFIGDEAQLPPIGEERSESFDQGESVMLDEVVRTANDNPIIQYLTIIRSNLNKSSMPFSRTNNANELGGVFFYKEKVQFLRAISKAFLGAAKNDGLRSIKCLAWSNNRVKNINNYVRTVLYPDAEEELVIGEFMIANSPIKIPFDDGISVKQITAVQNSEEFIVKGFTKKLFDNKYEGYNITAQMLSDGRTEYFNMLSSEGLKVHKKYLKALKETAIDEKSSERWKKYYAEKERYADVQYGYAMTVHKSQGSTYSEVFIHEIDIELNKRIIERNQCRYVAYSRASRAVHVYNA